MSSPQAFEAFYTRHRAPLLRYASRLANGRDDLAEDLAQDAFARAHRCFVAAGRDLPEPAWLYTVVRNAAIDEIRRQRRPIPIELAAGYAQADDAASVAARREEVRSIVADVVALPSRQRRALVGHAVDGHPHGVLARRDGSSESASKTLVTRARAALCEARALRAVA
ncbi:MAG TPA: RNA polymerase sigma factor [Solirubrobacteraceae bacterium]|jgi:RNA polymerase sigma-70 factor (ECF subfamily)